LILKRAEIYEKPIFATTILLQTMMGAFVVHQLCIFNEKKYEYYSRWMREIQMPRAIPLKNGEGIAYSFLV